MYWPFTVWVNCFSEWEKLLKFEAEGWEFVKKFLITITLFSQSRSKQFGDKIPLMFFPDVTYVFQIEPTYEPF